MGGFENPLKLAVHVRSEDGLGDYVLKLHLANSGQEDGFFNQCKSENV